MGNEKIIGKDYRKIPEQKKAATQAFHSEKVIVAGPVNLIQGGQALLLQKGVQKKFQPWALLTGVITLENLIPEPTDFELISIQGKDGLGKSSGFILKSNEEKNYEYVFQRIFALPTGHWVIKAEIPTLNPQVFSQWEILYLIGFLLSILLVLLINKLEGNLLSANLELKNTLRRSELESARKSNQILRQAEKLRVTFDQISEKTIQQVQSPDQIQEIHRLAEDLSFQISDFTGFILDDIQTFSYQSQKAFIPNIIQNLRNNLLKVFPKMKKIIDLFDTNLHLLKVNTPSRFQRTHDSVKLMEEFSSEFGLEKCTTNIYNDLTIEDGIINFTKSIHADLIAITPDGLWRLGHILKKNTTDKLMKKSVKVILSMKTQQPVLTPTEIFYEEEYKRYKRKN